MNDNAIVLLTFLCGTTVIAVLGFCLIVALSHWLNKDY